MKRLLFLLSLIWPSLLLAQKVLVIEYNDGTKRAEDINRISQITLSSSSEWQEDRVADEVSRGLQAYYTFDLEHAEDLQGYYPGFMNGGSFILDTPNSGGKALNLKEGQFVNIPYIPLNGRNTYSISLWLKDFGTGCIFKSQGGNYIYGPSLFVTPDMKLKYQTGYGASYSSVTFNTDLSSFQSDQWIMVTVVTETAPSGSSSYSGTSTLYINGQRADSGTCRTSDNAGSAMMVIGGYQEANLTSKLAEPMKIDNLRLYSIALTDEEVSTIYERESHLNNITVSTQNLLFDTQTDVKSFIVSNHASYPIKYSVSTIIEGIDITPSSGTIPAESSITVSAKVAQRTQSGYKNGTITVVAEKAKYAIMTEVLDGTGTESKIAVPRGLCAYYTFDDGSAKNVAQTEGVGTCTGGRYVSDTPNGKGKALYLNQKDYVTIDWAPLDGKRTYTFSMWVKDFGVGCLFKSFGGSNLYGPSLFVTENGKWLYQTGYGESYSGITYSPNVAPFQANEWTMLTVVTKSESTSSSNGTSILYINGRRAGMEFSRTNNNTGSTTMIIGGQRTTQANSLWAEAMTVDNIRLYTDALTDEEVAELYAAEK